MRERNPGPEIADAPPHSGKKDTRWKPGQSGNPKGRPRKRPKAITSRQYRADFLKALQRRVPVRIAGKLCRPPLEEIAVDKLLMMAAQGNFAAIKLVLQHRRKLVREHEETQKMLGELLLKYEEQVKTDPTFMAEPEDQLFIRELRRRVLDPFTLD